jgi:hypothetical protein
MGHRGAHGASGVAAVHVGGQTRIRGVVRRWQPWLIVASYGACVLGLFWQFSTVARRQIPLTPTSDQVQQVWFLAWPAHALRAGLNPLFSHAMNVPHGVNLMTNTSEPLLGLLFAPFTWWAGPLATYVLVLELGFFLSAVSAAAAARVLGASWFGAWFVGLLFGFGAPRLVNGVVHAYFTVDLVLPWLLVAAVRLVQGSWSPLRTGLFCGVLLGLDMLISPERVAIEVITLVGISLGWLLVVRRRSIAATLGSTALWVGAVLVPLAAYPAAMLLIGPEHVHGAPHAYIQQFTATFSSLVQPGPYAMFAPVGAHPSQFSLSAEGWTNGTYLGIPLIVLALLGAWRWRRSTLDRSIAAASLIALGLSFGGTISVFGLDIPSPYRLLLHLPLFGDIIPGRFVEVAICGVAWLAARALTLPEGRTAASSPVHVAAAALATVAVVATLLPAHTIRAAKAAHEPFFTSHLGRTLLPARSQVLTYPYPVSVFNTTMLNQAQAAMRYDLMGGQAIVPGPDGTNTGVLPQQPQAIIDLFLHAYLGPKPITLNFPVGPTPPLDAATLTAMRAYVVANRVDEICWQRSGHYPLLAKTYLDAAFGTLRIAVSPTLVVYETRRLFDHSTKE